MASRRRGHPNVEKAYGLMAPCALCPRECAVNRLEGEVGFCGIGEDVLVSSAGPHFGEEPPLVGSGGSGTIFFAGCNLGCVFCQNYDISHLRRGERVSIEDLCEMMLALESSGCHNVNWVTPTHVVPQIMEATLLAREKGLRAPTVYNCGGYESIETLKLLEGIVDIYMPDAKYGRAGSAEKLSRAKDYPAKMKAAIKEMHRQVGDLDMSGGIATRGLLVRHLVVPNDLAGSKEVIDFLADEVSPNTYVNVMEQYRPCFEADEYPEIDRRLTMREFREVYDYAQQRGLRLAD